MQTLWGFVALHLFLLSYAMLLHGFVCFVFHGFCVELPKKPHYIAFYLAMLFFTVSFGFIYVGLIANAWLKLVGESAMPAWFLALFQPV